MQDEDKDKTADLTPEDAPKFRTERYSDLLPDPNGPKFETGKAVHFFGEWFSELDKLMARAPFNAMLAACSQTCSKEKAGRPCMCPHNRGFALKILKHRFEIAKTIQEFVDSPDPVEQPSANSFSDFLRETFAANGIKVEVEHIKVNPFGPKTGPAQ